MKTEFDSFVTINDVEINVKAIGYYCPPEQMTRYYPGCDSYFEIWDVICLDNEGEFKKGEDISWAVSKEDFGRLKEEGFTWAEED